MSSFAKRSPTSASNHEASPWQTNLPPTSRARRAEADLLPTPRSFRSAPAWTRRRNEGPVFERALGSVVWDVNDKEYLDFNSGQMCSALGHNHPTVAAAIKDAATRCCTRIPATTT